MPMIRMIPARHTKASKPRCRSPLLQPCAHHALPPSHQCTA